MHRVHKYIRKSTHVYMTLCIPIEVPLEMKGTTPFVTVVLYILMHWFQASDNACIIWLRRVC